MNCEKQLRFDIKENAKKIDDMTDEEIEDNQVVSSGFWYSIEEGDGDMFVELLEDAETKQACYQALSILSKLERAVDDYVEWI
jgi:hypothetical protein